MQSETDIDTVPDRIEREIALDATSMRVWDLIARRGWWINEGRSWTCPPKSRVMSRRSGTPPTAPFRIQTVALEEPRYAAYRWLGGANDGAEQRSGAAETARTLVEFWIVEQAAGGVLLRVVESGLASLPGGPAAQRATYEENERGWRQELEAARVHVTRGGRG
ncbi:MAG: hypothetical protein ACR2FV_01035 [Ornithinimicrobium sp.]|jgi:hypothetical protein|uniref:hypothetical protein n=1 Tax=Ornithinimicrobium sp. TaxID=1977084 RepID=UPI003D9BDC25